MSDQPDDSNLPDTAREPAQTPGPRRRLPVVVPGKNDRPPPMFNMPPGIKFLILILIAIYAGQALMPAAMNIVLIDTLGFYPYRYWLLLHGQTGGPLFQVIVTPLTYMFLHANWIHLAINVLSLAAFGSVVERMAGVRYMIWLFLLCGIAGAFCEFAVDPTSHANVIGASGGISGLFAVAFMTLVRQQAMARRKMVMVICLLLVVMSITGIVGMPGMHIAWVSHIGGFLAGLLADASLSRRDGTSRLRDLGWLAALIALPLLFVVTNISRFF